MPKQLDLFSACLVDKVRVPTYKEVKVTQEATILTSVCLGSQLKIWDSCRELFTIDLSCVPT